MLPLMGRSRQRKKISPTVTKAHRGMIHIPSKRSSKLMGRFNKQDLKRNFRLQERFKDKPPTAEQQKRLGLREIQRDQKRMAKLRNLKGRGRKTKDLSRHDPLPMVQKKLPTGPLYDNSMTDAQKKKLLNELSLKNYRGAIKKGLTAKDRAKKVDGVLTPMPILTQANKGGLIKHTDYRKTGMFYGGIVKKKMITKKGI